MIIGFKKRQIISLRGAHTYLGVSLCFRRMKFDTKHYVTLT